MSQSSNLVAVMTRGRGMMEKHLADFSDADMLARSSPAANHAAYQIGHLIRINDATVAAFVPSFKTEFPPKTDNASKAPPTSDDPSAFASKGELLTAYHAQLDALLAAVGKMSEADFDKASPDTFKNFAPTLGQLAMMVPFH